MAAVRDCFFGQKCNKMDRCRFVHPAICLLGLICEDASCKLTHRGRIYFSCYNGNTCVRWPKGTCRYIHMGAVAHITWRKII
ncbi:MAG: hypothetical protein Hyperionvirus5_90 [Hyperionvirus sp.]|uniref:C3H1-type domain-containing protein n=1 Tax=Hyperionvirus sp. TaxID=2487770 RepID=A0A3G5A9W9_9VIRU|nr:MAG: hypothetical protein Hyperionvirus5_90 [Hyperionvirus sp.]